MAWQQMIHLESNGFFSATWLVQDWGGLWGLWPDIEGNRNDDEGSNFIVWIGEEKDVIQFVYQAMLCALTRAVFEFNSLVIEPNDGGDNCIQVRYKGKPAEVTQEGARFIGLCCSADQGNFAVLWYPGQSLLLCHLAVAGGEPLVEQWEGEHEQLSGRAKSVLYGRGVPGKEWGQRREVYDLLKMSWWTESTEEEG